MMASRSPIRDAVDALKGQHALGSAIPVDGRRAIVGIVGKVLAELLGRRRLHAQVHLDPHDVGEGAHRIDRLQAAIARLGTLDQLGRPIEEIEVALKASSMPGRSTLTATSRPSVVTAKCTWAIEAAATGVSSKLVNNAVDRLAELGLDDAPGRRRRGTPADGPAIAPGRPRPVRSKIGARRQGLAELDEGRTHLLQRRRQALARPAGIAAAREQPCPGDQRRRDAQDLQREQRIVPRLSAPCAASARNFEWAQQLTGRGLSLVFAWERATPWRIFMVV